MCQLRAVCHVLGLFPSLAPSWENAAPQGGGGVTTGLHKRGSDTSRSTGHSGRQNAATQRNMRREDRVTVQGPVKEQQPDGMSHRGGGAYAYGLRPA